MDLKNICVFVLFGSVVSCGKPAAVDPATMATVAAIALAGTDGRTHALVDGSAEFTVIELFSAHCPCQAAHDERVRALAAAYRPRGVTVQLLSSEGEVDRATEVREAAKRKYDFPILHDEGGNVGRALGAEYATYTVIFDRTGHALYRGGFDSDKLTLHDDAQMYVRDALDDLLAGKAPRRATAKTLGCALSF